MQTKYAKYIQCKCILNPPNIHVLGGSGTSISGLFKGGQISISLLTDTFKPSFRAGNGLYSLKMPFGSVFHTSVVICYVRARSENNIKVQQAKMLMLYNSYFKRQILPWRIYDLTSDKTQGDVITIK